MRLLLRRPPRAYGKDLMHRGHTRCSLPSVSRWQKAHFVGNSLKYRAAYAHSTPHSLRSRTLSAV